MEISLKKKFVIFLLLNCFYFFSYFHRVAIPGTIFNELQMDFHLTANQVTTLGVIVFYIYGILQFFVGPCLDRFGTNKIFVAGGFLLCIGSVLFAVSHSIFLLYFSRTLVGIGASVAYLGIVKKTDELFGRDFFAIMLGVALFLGYSGGLFATLPFERLVHAFGWRNPIFVMSIILFFVMILIVSTIVKQHQFSQQKNSFSLDDIRSIILNKKIYPVLIVAAINFTIYFIFQAIIGKKLIQDTSGLTSRMAASFTLIMMLTTMIAALLWGSIVHIVKQKKLLVIIVCLVSMISCILMTVNLIFHRVAAVFLLCFFLFALTGGSGPLTTTLIKELGPAFGIGTSVGFVNGVCYISVAIAGNISGFIMDKFSSKAIVSPDAVIYPSIAYATIAGFCLFLNIVSFVVSFKISEPEKEIELKVPVPL
ncbi:MAG TPA: MFS transporter [bacterium]|nr:MFS transporter [bacterium]HOL34834.1 MFS transporter [bacterium]HPP07911.1 MFS transporter [bacterium]